MSGFKNITLNEYLKRYGIRYSLKRGMFLTNPFHYVSDYETKKILYYHKTKNYLKKNYLKFAETDPSELLFPIVENQIYEPIWVYWKQGIDNAPDIVKKCIASVIKYYGDRTVLLNNDNLNDYLRLPSYIVQKASQGSISDAAVADLIRYTLLEKYGGTWIDATVLLTDKLPEYIENSDFFSYKDLCGAIYNPANRTNWLIHSKTHTDLIRWTRNMLFSYWNYEKYVIEYLVSYIFMEIAAEMNKKYIEQEISVSSNSCYLLLQKLGENFSEQQFEMIKKQTSVHKLTYKLMPNVFKNEANFYHKILKEN